MVWSVVLLAADSPAWAQRPLTSQHVGELAQYLDCVKIAEPVVSDHLAVYPVIVSGPSLLRGGWLTLDAALSTGALAITERHTGATPVSWVENATLDEHLFLMKGEVIRRGTQIQLVRRDTVLAPGARIELNAVCAQLPPSAGAKPLSAGGTIERPKELCRDIVPRIPSGTTGFIFVCDGQPLAADFFGSEDLALRLLPKLLESRLLGQVTAPNSADDRDGAKDGLEGIEFFEHICGAGSQVVGTTGSGVAIQTREGRLVGGGVVLDGLLVHYGIRVEELGTPYRRGRPSIIWPRSERHRQRQ